MTFFQFNILASLAATTATGAFVILSQPHRRINQSFLWLCVITFMWQTVLWLSTLTRDPAYLAFLIRQSSVAAALIPASMHLLRLSILHRDLSFTALLRKNQFWWFASLAFGVLCQFPFFLVTAHPPVEEYALATPEYGPGFIFYSLYYLFSILLLVFRLVRDQKLSTGVAKTEVGYILLSCATSLSLGTFFLIIPFITSRMELGALIPLSVVAFFSITGYGIATRGILDVPVLARRLISWLILVIYLLLLYFFCLFLGRLLFQGVNLHGETIPHLFAAMVIALSGTPAYGVAKGMTNRLFIHSPPLDTGAIWREGTRTLHSAMHTRDLCRALERTLHDNLEVSSVRIYLLKGDRWILLHPAAENPVLDADPQLLRHWEQNRSMAVAELLPRSRETKSQNLLLKFLQRNQADTALPFYRGKELTGLMLLGPRTSGRVYGWQEQEALEGLRDLFSVSYENACLSQEIQRKERLAGLGTLSAGIAHEIKNPLVTLKTFTQLLPKRYEDPEFRETFSSLAGREIKRIDTLVNQLLRFARPSKPQLAELHLHPLLESQSKEFRQHVQVSSIEIILNCAATEDRVLADEDQLRQVMLNLLMNAEQAMPEGGSIRIETGSDRKSLQVMFSDNGPGIPQDLLPHIFDPFYTTKPTGSGLGLAVAHHILREHRAEITVNSIPGEGTTFTLLFPLAKSGSSS